MAGGKYDRYIIDDPKLVRDLAHHDFSAVKGFTYPDEVYIDEELCPEANAWLDIVWVWEKTVPAELPGLHRHPFPEIVLLIGSNPRDLRDLGGEVSWGMGEGADAERFTLTAHDGDLRATGSASRAARVRARGPADPQHRHRPQDRRVRLRVLRKRDRPPRVRGTPRPHPGDRSLRRRPSGPRYLQPGGRAPDHGAGTAASFYSCQCSTSMRQVLHACPGEVGVMKRLDVRMLTQPARSGESPGAPVGA